LPTITAHIIVRDAARAADWYAQALGAEIGARIRVPNGRHLQIELRLGDSQLMIADEFPEMGAVSPQTLHGTYGALTVAVDDADAAWQRALDAGAEVFHELEDAFWGRAPRAVHRPFRSPLGRGAAARGDHARGGRAASGGPVRRACGIAGAVSQEGTTFNLLGLLAGRTTKHRAMSQAAPLSRLGGR
jgi:PhnB protein